MKAYIGTKLILAELENKDGAEGYKVIYPDGYVSWSPKDVFENAYREVTDDEVNIVVDSVTDDLTSKDIAELVELISEDEAGDLALGNEPEGAELLEYTEDTKDEGPIGESVLSLTDPADAE